MKVRGDFLGPPRSTDKTTLIIKVSKVAKIRNRYNQVPHLTQDTNGKVTNSQKTPQTRAKRSFLNDQNTFLVSNALDYHLVQPELVGSGFLKALTVFDFCSNL